MSLTEDPTLKDNLSSKTRRKKDMHDLQEFSKVLIDLSYPELLQLNIDASLLTAIKLAQKTKNIPRVFNREVQYVAKLLKTLDYQEIQSNTDRLFANRSLNYNKTKEVEAAFKVLLSADTEAINLIFAKNPDLEWQFVKNLVRQLHKEVDPVHGKSKNGKKLFNYLLNNLAI